MFEINPGLFLWTILTFLVVLAILRWAAWKPLVGALAAREEKIRGALDQAEQARHQAQTLLDEHRPAGAHEATWRGTDAQGRPQPSGVYFVRLEADGAARTVKLTLAR